jgi:hypothetical protein
MEGAMKYIGAGVFAVAVLAAAQPGAAATSRPAPGLGLAPPVAALASQPKIEAPRPSPDAGAVGDERPGTQNMPTGSIAPAGAASAGASPIGPAGRGWCEDGQVAGTGKGFCVVTKFKTMGPGFRSLSE